MQERVYTMIKAMIKDGRIRPGERLLEAHVARAFAVSRSPARRALQALCIDKTVREGDGRGYVVVGRRGNGHGRDGEIANIGEISLESSPRWKQVHAELEREICVAVVYRSLRITEDRVAEHFDVSRTVARDALARLHSSGVVDKDRQGRWVAERITASRIRALYELRWLIEPEALVQSAQATPVGVVREARDKLRDALTDIPTLGSTTHIDLENDLHVRLLAACPNTELLRVLERTHLLLVSNPHRVHSYIDEPETHVYESLHQHLEVLDLLLKNKHERAADTLKRHLKESCAFWIEHWHQVQSHLAEPLPPYLVEAEPAA